MNDNASPTLITTQIAPQAFHSKGLPRPAWKPYRIKPADALACIFDVAYQSMHGFGLHIEVRTAWACLLCGQLVTAVAIGNEPAAVYDAFAETIPSALRGGRPPVTIYYAKLAYFHECLYCQSVECQRYLHSRRRYHELMEPQEPEKELSRCQ